MAGEWRRGHSGEGQGAGEGYREKESDGGTLLEAALATLKKS